MNWHIYRKKRLLFLGKAHEYISSENLPNVQHLQRSNIVGALLLLRVAVSNSTGNGHYGGRSHFREKEQKAREIYCSSIWDSSSIWDILGKTHN